MDLLGATADVVVRRITRCGDDVLVAPKGEMDVVVTEEPLEIRVEGRALAVTMRTPGHDKELAVGFLLAEGVIRGAGDVFDVVMCPSAGGGTVEVSLRDPSKMDWEGLSRHIITPGSCGVCGKTSIATALRRHAALDGGDGFTVEAGVLLGLPERLREMQAGFAATGGSHAAALFSSAGELLVVREDAGRHNAVDKLLGWAVLEGRLPLGNCGLLLSGRVSYELVQKALAGGISCIAAVGAPSSLAIDTAVAAGISLCGFLRPLRGNVYAHPERIK